MVVRLRQVAMVAGDLAAAERAVEEHLGLELCFRDPGVATFGLVNALYPVGEQLLEIVSPAIDGTTAGRLLAKRGGNGGYMVLVQVDDLGPVRERLVAANVRVVFEAAAEGVRGLHLHPCDVGGAILSIDRTDDWAEWPWAGPGWRDHVRTGTVTDLRAVEIEADDPAAMAARWAEVLDVEAAGTTLVLDEGEIRFVPAGDRGEGVAGFELGAAAGAGRELEVCGCRFRLVAPRTRSALSERG